MASSAHLLSWGLERWKDAYQNAGQLEMMYDMLKWPLDYFLKCWHPQTQEYYAQVDNLQEDSESHLGCFQLSFSAMVNMLYVLWMSYVSYVQPFHE